MRRFILVATGLFLFFSTNAQVVIGGDDEVKNDKPVKEKKQKTVDGKTSVYLMSNWSVTNRSLTENEGLYAEPLGKRADESALNTWSFGLGLRNSIHENVYWDGGISFYRNGESYLFNGQDTMFAYQTYYSYIAMPLRINATVGKDFQWNAGAGIVPQMFSSYHQEQQWETTTDSKGDETIKTNSGYNTFAISAIFNVGLTMNFSNGWGLFVSPEARIQLNSTYREIDPYVHKGRIFGVSFGLIRNL
jgi:hypothetical protein